MKHIYDFRFTIYERFGVREGQPGGLAPENFQLI
jgi:hypothetical protein